MSARVREGRADVLQTRSSYQLYARRMAKVGLVRGGARL
jgi:hypothetical protein